MLHDVFDLMDKISKGRNVGEMKVHEGWIIGIPVYGGIRTMSLKVNLVVLCESERFILS